MLQDWCDTCYLVLGSLFHFFLACIMEETQQVKSYSGRTCALCSMISTNWCLLVYLMLLYRLAFAFILCYVMSWHNNWYFVLCTDKQKLTVKSDAIGKVTSAHNNANTALILVIIYILYQQSEWASSPLQMLFLSYYLKEP